MTRLLARLTAPLLMALTMLVPTAQAAPLGVVSETAITATVGYSFSSGQAISLALEYELPVAVPVPVDVSITPRVGFGISSFGFGINLGVLAKVLILPSFSGGLLGAGVWFDMDFRNIATTINSFKVAFGPFLNINFEPFYATFSASLFSLRDGIYAFDLGLAARYYLETFGFEFSFDYNTIGYARASLGIRFLL